VYIRQQPEMDLISTLIDIYFMVFK